MSTASKCRSETHLTKDTAPRAATAGDGLGGTHLSQK